MERQPIYDLDAHLAPYRGCTVHASLTPKETFKSPSGKRAWDKGVETNGYIQKMWNGRLAVFSNGPKEGNTHRVYDSVEEIKSHFEITDITT